MKTLTYCPLGATYAERRTVYPSTDVTQIGRSSSGSGQARGISLPKRSFSIALKNELACVKGFGEARRRIALDATQP